MINALRITLAATLFFLFSQQLHAENEIVLSIPDESIYLDPYSELNDTSLFITHLLFDPLFRWQKNGELEPRLIKTWKQISVGRVNFELKKGIKFHSGNELTAVDIFWTFKRLQKSPAFNQIFANVKKIYVIDLYHFDIVTYDKKPFNLSCLSYFFPLDSRFYGQKIDLKKRASGTGAFYIAEREPGMSAIFKRHKNYWDKASAGNLSQIKLVAIADDSARLQAFIAGDLDVISSIDSIDFLKVEDAGNQLILAPEKKLLFLLFNLNVPLLSNDIFRQALIFTIDNKALVGRIMNGFADVASQLSLPDSESYNSELKQRFDLGIANSNLQKLTIKEGLILNLNVQMNADNKKLVSMLKLMFKQIDINLNQVKTEIVKGKKKPEVCPADIQLVEWYSRRQSLNDVLFQHFLSATDPKGENYCGVYSSPELEGLIAKLGDNIAQDTRLETLQKIEKILYKHAVFVPLYWQSRAWAARPDLDFSSAFGVLGFPYMGEVIVNGLKSTGAKI